MDSVPPKLVIGTAGTGVVTAGVICSTYFDAGDALHEAAAAAMKDHEIHIGISLGAGAAASHALGCDLSYEYVTINGEYTT